MNGTLGFLWIMPDGKEGKSRIPVLIGKMGPLTVEIIKTPSFARKSADLGTNFPFYLVAVWEEYRKVGKMSATINRLRDLRNAFTKTRKSARILLSPLLRETGFNGIDYYFGTWGHLKLQIYPNLTKKYGASWSPDYLIATTTDMLMPYEIFPIFGQGYRQYLNLLTEPKNYWDGNFRKRWTVFFRARLADHHFCPTCGRAWNNEVLSETFRTQKGVVEKINENVQGEKALDVKP